MDDTLRIIQYLYGEDVDDPDFARRVADDEDLRRECERLQETKAALDRRSPPSPDPSVVDDIVARAAAAPSPDESDAADRPAPADRAADRDARPLSTDWAHRLQGAAAALAIVLAVGLGWWQYNADPAAPASTAASSASAPPQTEATAAPEPQADADEIPAWDDRDEVVRLHRRIETLRTRSDAWGGDLQTVGRSR
jgi:negative regulator of sigma E activity